MKRSRKLLALAAGVVTGAAALAAWVKPGARRTPEAREQKRRVAVSRSSRMASGTTTDLNDGILSYTYSVSGVIYSAAQDLSAVLDLLPPAPETLIGRPVSVKYLAHNPANSIVLSEGWSGLLFRPQSERADSAN